MSLYIMVNTVHQHKKGNNYSCLKWGNIWIKQLLTLQRLLWILLKCCELLPPGEMYPVPKCLVATPWHCFTPTKITFLLVHATQSDGNQDEDTYTRDCAVPGCVWPLKPTKFSRRKTPNCRNSSLALPISFSKQSLLPPHSWCLGGISHLEFEFLSRNFVLPVTFSFALQSQKASENQELVCSRILWTVLSSWLLDSNFFARCLSIVHGFGVTFPELFSDKEF